MDKLNTTAICNAWVTDQYGKPVINKLHTETLTLTDACDAINIKNTENDNSMHETLHAAGIFHVECLDKDGTLLWKTDAPNTVVTVGKNSLLDNYLAGSSFTQTGPFMFLISSVSWSAISSSDTMSSHSGWLEAGNANAPTYTSPRPTCAWSAASGGSKSLSAALAFAITGTGTVKGVGLVLGSGAVSTIDNTGGTLFSAALFTGGDQAVINTNTLNVTYSLAV